MNKILPSLLFIIISHHSWAATSFLRPTAVPTTSADTTFAQRIENAITGYQPYANKSAYTTIQIETEEEFINRMVTSSEHDRKTAVSTLTREQYCDEYPLDADFCPQTPGLFESVVAIGNRKPSTPSNTKPVVQPTQQTTTPTKPVAQPTQPTATTTKPVVQPTQQTTAPTKPVAQPTYNRANKITFGTQCTPPQRSNHFTNKILTSGKYANIDPAFEKAMITTFRTEGECSNDPDDSGGYTCYGISQRNNPEVDVRKITRADAEDIAFDKYYQRYNIHKLPDNSRGNVFMLGWAGGPSTGIRKFCKFLGIPERNTIDDNIVTAATNYSGDIHNDFLDAQQQFYIDVAKRNNNQKFLKGWMNRVKLMRENGCHSETTDALTR